MSVVFDLLCIHRAYHVDGLDTARSLARQCLARYRVRHPLNFAEVVACNAWLDMMALGAYSEDTKVDLKVFDDLGFVGLRAMHVAKGLLTG